MDNSDNAKDTTEYLRTAVAARVALRTTVGAVYVDQSGPTRPVIFAGGGGTLLTPEASLDRVLALVTDQTGGVDGIRARPAGPLGGILKCGSTKTDDGDMAVCGWADHGSVAVALFPGRGVDESARLLLQLRGAIQHR